MRLTLLTLLGLTWAFFAHSQTKNLHPSAHRAVTAQTAAAPLQPVALFQPAQAKRSLNGELQRYEHLTLDMEQLQALHANEPASLTLTLPYGARRNIEVELERTEVFSGKPQITESQPSGKRATDRGLHYRGRIKGVAGSLAAVSIFEGQVMGLFSTPSEGNLVLGAMGNEASGLDYVLYNDRDLERRDDWSCGTEDGELPYSPDELEDMVGGRGPGDCVRVYFEVDHDIFLQKGGTANTVAYVTALFNQVALLYEAESVNLVISEIFVWNVPSPYSGTQSHVLLTQFQNYRSSINGDLGQLLSYQASGGIAVLNGLCHPFSLAKLSFSSIGSSFQNVPVYSFTVMVVAHELGHLLGSNHTHACVWNGNGTGIDGCAGFMEGGCPNPGAPQGGGTIMSYCHISQVGINFTRGFGPQPGNVIRQRIAAATCLTACANGGGDTPCAAPANLAANPLTPNSVALNWPAVPAAANYTVQYRLNTTATWTTAPTTTNTSLTLTGLQPGSAYAWRVKANCSNYSSTAAFNTASSNCAAPTNLASNPLTPNSVALNWPAVPAAANYTVQYRLNTTATWTTAPTTTNTSLTLTGLQPGSAYTWRVKANCSDYSSTAAFNTASSNCAAPANLVANPLTPNSVALNWPAVPGTANYTVQYRLNTTATWTTAPTTTNTSLTLTGLQPGSAYTWRVKANCSNYSSTAAFNTASSNCAAPTNLASNPLTPNSVALNWPAVPAAANYTVQYRLNTTATWTTAPTTASTSLTLTGLQPGSAYTWRVKANCSNYSSTAAFNTSTASATCGLNRVILTVVIDDFGNETTWQLYNEADSTLHSGGDYPKAAANSIFRDTFCLPDGCYNFTMFDSYGDGMCCDFGSGSFVLRDTAGNILASGSQFSYKDSTDFCLPFVSDPEPAEPRCVEIDFREYDIVPLDASQDQGIYQVFNNGQVLMVQNNAWKAIHLDYNITANTVLEFDFGATVPGEIHGIGLSEGDVISHSLTFQLYGTQTWGIPNYRNYNTLGYWKHYTIPVGQFYTGQASRLFFAADHDAPPGNGNSFFANVRLYEGSVCETGFTSEPTAGLLPAVEETAVSLHPNPAAQVLHLNVRSAQGGIGQVRLFNAMGQLVRQQVLAVLEGTHSEQIDVSSLPQGTYVLQYDNGRQLVSEKFVVLRR